MNREPHDTTIRAIIRNALEACPAIIPQDRRWADLEGQRIAKECVTEHVARALAATGIFTEHKR